MHFLLLGASGRTGQLVAKQALAQNHTVTALVRNPTQTTQEHITQIQGTPTLSADLSKAFTTSTTPINAVIITLAVTRETDSPFSKLTGPRFLIRDTVRALLPIMKQHGTKKLIVMSAFGSGSSWANMAWPLKAVMKWTDMSYVYEDHDAVDAELRGEAGEGLEWTLVKPVMLKDFEEVKEVKEFGEEGKGTGMLSNVTRGSVASVLVRAAEDGGWAGRAVVISN